MFTVESPIGLRNFLTLVQGRAPDRFEGKDNFLESEHQLNLERAYTLLYEGMGMMCAMKKFKTSRNTLKKLLDESLEAYQKGDEDLGLKLLWKFEDILFGPPESSS